MTVKNAKSTDIGPNTRRLLSYSEMQQRLYLSRTQTFRLEREGARLLPDVAITPSGAKGWDPDRVLRYGVETGRLNEDGTPAGGWDEAGRPLNRVPDGSLPTMRRLVEDKYSDPPRVYLGSAACSYVYGHDESSVYFLRSRGVFIPASVRVGDKLLGWKEDDVIEFGFQTGRLERQPDNWEEVLAQHEEEMAAWQEEMKTHQARADAGAVEEEPQRPKVPRWLPLRNWAHRRTEEFGMDPNTPWVVDLLGEDNLPEYRLTQAAQGDTPGTRR